MRPPFWALTAARQHGLARPATGASEKGATAGGVLVSKTNTRPRCNSIDPPQPNPQGLGYAIVAGASIVKLPQILAVARAGSARGLSPLSAELEEVGLSIAAAFGLSSGLPFSTFGESVFLFLQNTVLLGLIYAFTGARARGAIAAAAAALWLRFLASPAFTPAIARRAMDASTAIFLSARLPQIAANFKNKSTGTLSLATYAANTLGGLARVATTLQAGAGGALLRNYALGAVLNATVVAQILWFGDGKKKKRGKGGKGVAATPGRRSARLKAA